MKQKTIISESFCTNCGYKLKSGAKFCTKCGQSVSGDQVILRSKSKKKSKWLWWFGGCFVAFLVILAAIGIISSFIKPLNKNKVERSTEPLVITHHEVIPCPAQVRDPKHPDLNEQKNYFVEDVTYFEYEVRGSSKSEVHADLDRCNPPSHSGEDYYGLYNSSYSYIWEREMEDSECKVTSVTLHLYSDIYYPKWMTPNPSWFAEWDTAVKNTLVHEEGHRQISTDATNKILALDRITAPDCDALDKKFNIESDKIAEDEKQRQIKYDAETDHGATQGARFYF